MQKASFGKGMITLGSTRKNKLLLLSLVAVPLVLAVFYGCTTAQTEAPSKESATEATQNGGVIRNAEWKDEYPEVYGSYMAGADVIKEEPSKGTDVTSRSHSHAVMDDTFSLIAKQYSPRGPYRIQCLNCHSADFERYYEEYGEGAFDMELGGWDYLYNDLHENGQDVEFWGCYQCHENDPENTLKTTVMVYNEGVTATQDFALEDGVCGQCHRIPFSDKDVDIYKYGTDPDSVGKAQLEEYGWMMSVCTDLEMFQNSTHQSLGLTCVSCHMPEQTNDEGVTFTNHDASGSPLEKEASLDFCLTCHEAQGITSHSDMIDFVKGKQSDVADAQGKLRGELEELTPIVEDLEAQVKAGDDTVDQDLLKSMKDAQMWADFYLGWTVSGTTTDGTNAPHNYEQMMTILSRGSNLVNDALATV